jgi:formylglycine-generating enzyme required for sulfatase activity/class 3 adenylate cyclase
VIGSPRRLAAILAADVAGYSRLMGADEEGTHARMKRHRREIIDPTLQEHYGRLIKSTGDGFLAVFDSPLEAVRCAIVIQQSMAARNLSLPRTQWIQYRIGVNLGDVIIDDDDVYGEGVNIAARLETLAEPGGVYISGGVYEQIKNKLVCGYQSLGDERLKNITDPVRIYRVLPDPAAVAQATRSKRRISLLATGSLVSAAGIAWLMWTFERTPDRRHQAAHQAPVGVEAQAAMVQPDTPPAAAPLPNLPAPPPAPPDAPAIAIPQASPGGQQEVAVLAPPAPAMRPPEPGSIFRDCANCPEMVNMPGGTFRMGSSEDPSELPIHQVSIAPFALGRFPVTVAEWNHCAAARACGFIADGDPRLPVRNVSWNDAQDYVTWLVRTTSRPYRLPSEAEWEFAARAGTTGRYWWGDKIVPKMASCKGCGGPTDSRQPVNVGTFPSNPFGLHDMTGTIDQWVADCWSPDYRGIPTDGSPRAVPNCRENVLRGGSWRNDASYARSASRARYDTSVRYPTHGFRVARSF